MKTKLLLITIASFCLAILFQASIWMGNHITETDLAPESAPSNVAIATPPKSFKNYPQGITQIISLNSDDGTKQRLSKREWKDQVLDWLLMAVVGDSGLTAHDVGAALFDLPPLRYGYIKASGQLEYGETRSCYIGDGRILALVPADVSRAARTDAIADVVDRHRKDQAGEVSSVELFEYRLSDDILTAEITRLASHDVSDSLIAKEGYYEAIITSNKDLHRFLKKIDDLTFAEITSKGLRLGGRKIRSYDFRGIGLQEVAAVWQSEQDIKWKNIEFQAFVASEQLAYNNYWRNRTYYGEFDQYQLKQQADREWQQIENKIRARARELHIVEGSGFSLDPTYDYNGLANLLYIILADAEARHVDSAPQTKDMEIGNIVYQTIQRKRPQIEKAIVAISNKNIIPLLTIINDLETSSRPEDYLSAIYLKEVSDRFKFQAARYDGKLQGTETGMVLFYTDLLAKIWAMDYLDSAPGDKINEFVDDTNIKLASIYDSERRELSSSRLWFGPTDRGFQIANNKQLFFQRISTRVYSLGNNPLDPTNEVQTSAFLAAPIDWWDDHYAEIARYEPEYFRLNEIMKWSLVIGFLNEEGNDNLLGFLNKVKVERSKWFPFWARANKKLRFNLWNNIDFYEPGFKGTTTEAMQYLKGKLTEGGVSLAPKKLFHNRSGITKSISKLNRRSNINYASARHGTGTFKTLDGVAVKIQRIDLNTVSIQNSPKSSLRLRSAESDFHNVPFKRIISKTDNKLTVRTSAEGTQLGELNIAKTGNGFKIGWHARDIDAGQTLALRVSRSSDPVATLTKDPNVVQLVKMPSPDTYAVKLRSSEKWLLLNRGGVSDATVSSGWQSRVADPKGGSSYKLKWVDKHIVEEQVSKSQWMVLHPSSDSRIAFADVQSRGPPTQGITKVPLNIDGKPISATVDRSSGLIYISTKQLPGNKAKHILDIPRDLSNEQFKQIRTVVTSTQGDTPISLTKPHNITKTLQNGDIRRVAIQITSSPKDASRAFDQALSKEFKSVSKLIAKDEIGSAVSQLNRIQRIYGPQPEIKLWEGLAELSRGRTRQAAQVLGNSKPGRIRNPDSFFKEINARLAEPGLARGGRHSLKNLLHYAEWQRQSGVKMSAHGNSVAHVDNNTLSFKFHSVQPLQKGRVLTNNEAQNLSKSDVQYYRQSSPGLNNLDWNVSQKQAFSQAIELRLGKVLELPHGDIASLNPTKIIVSTDPAVSTKPMITMKPGHVSTSATNMTRSINSGNEDEEDDEEYIRMGMRKPTGNRLYLLVDESSEQR